MTTTKPHMNLKNKYDHVVVLIDMDCFYCQVEEKLDPTLKGKPIAVVQYNAWKGGGIIAVNYVARDKGVTRHMRGDEAKESCPEIELVSVPSVREKADLSKYREAGAEVAAVLQSFSTKFERASIDEAYLDITKNVVERIQQINNESNPIRGEELLNTHVVGYENIGTFLRQMSEKVGSDDFQDDFDDGMDDTNRDSVQQSDLKLLVGAAIVNEMRAKVKAVTGYECSAGVAHNKILAKLACGINKPNKQTILPLNQTPILFSTLPVRKIKGLGGKFGEEICAKFGVQYIGELRKYSEKEIQKKTDEKNGSWLYLISKGIDLEAVVSRSTSKSIGCCKNFPGQNAITTRQSLEHWLLQLANEICERMEKDVIENKRKATNMVVSFTQDIRGEDVSSSRTTALSASEAESLAKDALDLIRKNTEKFYAHKDQNNLHNHIKFLGISIGKFQPIVTNKNSIQKMFGNCAKKKETDVLTEKCAKVLEEMKECVESSKITNGFFSNLTKTSDKGAILTVGAEGKKIDKELTINNSESEELPKNSRSFFAKFFNSKTENQKTSEPAADSPLNKVKIISEEHVILVNNNEIDRISPKKATAEKKKRTISDEEGNLEIQLPELGDEFYTKCEECGQKILSVEIQEHQDFHFAMQLSKKQRENFRGSAIKGKNTQSTGEITSPKKKKIKITKNLTVVKQEKFLDLKQALFSRNVSKATPNTATCSTTVKEESQNTEVAIEEDIFSDETFVETEDVIDCGQSIAPSEFQVNDQALDKNIKQRCDKCNEDIDIETYNSHQDYHFAMEISQAQRQEYRQKFQSQKPTSSAAAKSKNLTKTGRTVKQKPILSFIQKRKPPST